MLEQEVKVLLDKNGLLWDDFIVWMVGKTITYDEKGITIYQKHDVQKFIRFKKSGIDPVGFD